MPFNPICLTFILFSEDNFNIDAFYVRRHEKSISLKNGSESPLMELFERFRYKLYKIYRLVGDRRLSEFKFPYRGADFSPMSDYGRPFVKKAECAFSAYSELLDLIEDQKENLLLLPFEFLLELNWWFLIVEQRVFLNSSEAALRRDTDQYREILSLYAYVISSLGGEKSSPVYTYTPKTPFCRRHFSLWRPPKAIRFKKDRYRLVDRGICPYFYYVYVQRHVLDLKGCAIDEFLQSAEFVDDGLSVWGHSEALVQLWKLNYDSLRLFLYTEHLRSWLPRLRPLLRSRLLIDGWSSVSYCESLYVKRKYSLFTKLWSLTEDFDFERLFRIERRFFTIKELPLRPPIADWSGYVEDELDCLWVLRWADSPFHSFSSWGKYSGLFKHRHYFILLNQSHCFNISFYKYIFLLRSGFFFLGWYTIERFKFKRYYYKVFNLKGFKPVFQFYSIYDTRHSFAFSTCSLKIIFFVKKLFLPGAKKRILLFRLFRCKTFKTLCWSFLFTVLLSLRLKNKKSSLSFCFRRFKKSLRSCGIAFFKKKSCLIFNKTQTAWGSKKRPCVLLPKKLNEILLFDTDDAKESPVVT